MGYRDKIYKDAESIKVSIGQKPKDTKVVFTNGVYDLIHIGHLRCLEEAKGHGDMLIVGINSDDSVKRIKGKGRPINKEATRTAIIAALECVDAVILFDEDTPLRLIKILKPHVLVKGGDYKVEDIAGASEVIAAGGRVELIPIVEGYSSTDIIERIKKL